MSVMDGGPSGFSIARVLGRVFRTGWRTMPLLGGVSLMIALVVIGVQYALNMAVGIKPGTLAPATGQPQLLALPAYGIVLFLVAVAQVAFTQAMVTFGAVEVMNGETLTLGRALKAGVRFGVPVLAVEVGVGFLIALGSLLLIIPGILVAVAFAVVAPAAIFERGGFPAAFTSSRDLTRNYRWMVFAVLAVCVILEWLALLAVGGVGVGFLFSLSGGAVPTLATAGAPAMLAFTIVSTVANTFLGVFMTCVPPAIYVELKAIKHGPDRRRTADVFS